MSRMTYNKGGTSADRRRSPLRQVALVCALVLLVGRLIRWLLLICFNLRALKRGFGRPLAGDESVAPTTLSDRTGNGYRVWVLGRVT